MSFQEPYTVEKAALILVVCGVLFYLLGALGIIPILFAYEAIIWFEKKKHPIIADPTDDCTGLSSGFTISKQQRCILAGLYLLVIGCKSAYGTIHGVGMDARRLAGYEAHPFVAILGGIFPSIVLAPIVYWVSGRPWKAKPKKEEN